jgi:hypothetical protein
MLQISRTLRAQVDNDVQDGASHASDELGFGCRRVLKVHAADGSRLYVIGEIGLRDDGSQPVRLEFMLAELASEKPSGVLSPLNIDNVSTSQLSFRKYHASTPPAFISIPATNLAAKDRRCQNRRLLTVNY